MPQIHAIGLDVAKNILQVHGVDKAGKTVLRRKLQRKQVADYFLKLKPCLIGMEVTGGVHFWGRLLAGMGHSIKLVPAAYVKAYVKTNKNDAADAEAICEATVANVTRF